MIYQEALCYVCYIYKVKEINDVNIVQNVLIYDSLSFIHFFLSVLAFMPISRFKTNAIKWEGKLQIYIMCMHSTDITLYQWFGILLVILQRSKFVHINAIVEVKHFKTNISFIKYVL